MISLLTPRRMRLWQKILRLGKRLEVEMGKSATPPDDEPDNGAAERSPPRKKQQRAGLIARLQSSISLVIRGASDYNKIRSSASWSIIQPPRVKPKPFLSATAGASWHLSGVRLSSHPSLR